MRRAAALLPDGLAKAMPVTEREKDKSADVGAQR
jgi:hypothetical protein